MLEDSHYVRIDPIAGRVDVERFGAARHALTSELRHQCRSEFIFELRVSVGGWLETNPLQSQTWHLGEIITARIHAPHTDVHVTVLPNICIIPVGALREDGESSAANVELADRGADPRSASSILSSSAVPGAPPFVRYPDEE